MLRRIAQWIRAHRHAMWVVMDQMVVSGSNFLLGIAMARLLGVERYGQWVLLFAVVLYANTYSSSLVQAPMLTLLPRAEAKERQQLLRGSLTIQILLSLLLAVVTAAGVALADRFLVEWRGTHLVLPIGLLIIGFQLQDWVRRSFFSLGQSIPVLTNDIIAYGGQLALVIVLGRYDALNVQRALLVLAGCYLTGFCMGILRLRIRPSWEDAKNIVRTTWRTSRDYFLSWQFQWLGSQGVLFIGAGSLGVQSAGAIRAAQNLLGPTNVLFQTLENVVPVRCSLHHKKGGNPALFRYLTKVTLFGGVPLGVFLLAVGVFGNQILNLAYGAAYQGYGYLVAMHALYFGISFLVRLLTYVRRTWDQTRLIFIASLISAVVAVAVTAFTVGSLADKGVLLGSIAGVAVTVLILATVKRSRETMN